MEAGMLMEFMNKTGCDSETAHMFLQTYNWDLSLAFDIWYQNEIASETVDKSEVKKLARGISRAAENEFLVRKARDAIAKDFENNRLCRVSNYCVETPETSFSLPDITLFLEEFRDFLEKDLIEKSVLYSLEGSGRLNWWCNQLGYSTRLWPLSTTGDGNCLLHAASLSMYGFHDRPLTLRHALYGYITNSVAADAIKRRWRWQQTKSNLQSGVEYSEYEWEMEWDAIVNMASARKRQEDPNGSYESLEEIHILFLAHVLRRVIIVISETVLKDSFNQPLSPIHFGGVYIPFECDQTKCYKSPLLLTYDMAHFSALVFMEEGNAFMERGICQSTEKSPTASTFCIPVVDSNGSLLPIQFSIDPGQNFNWDHFANSEFHAIDNNKDEQLQLLKTYLVVVNVWGPANSPENESEDEIDRHYVEYNDQTDGDSNNIFHKKNKAAKQLEILGKQFGSIGKSMSKKIKQNFGSLTKLAATNSKPKTKENIKWKFLCIEILIKKHPYQLEMIRNYMKFAEERFIRGLLGQYSCNSPADVLLKEQAVKEGLVICINNCETYATSYTYYMCAKCFETQKKQEEIKMTHESIFGIGKSKFYREPGLASYGAIKKIPKSILKNDHTLYLSNSTFFNDTDLPFYNNNTSTDLNQNFKEFDVSIDKENQPPRPRSRSAGQKAHLDNVAKLPPKKEVPVEKLITEFDYGQIPIPESSKKYLANPTTFAAKKENVRFENFARVAEPRTDATPPDLNLNILATQIQTMINNDCYNNQSVEENPTVHKSIKTESDL